MGLPNPNQKYSSFYRLNILLRGKNTEMINPQYMILQSYTIYFVNPYGPPSDLFPSQNWMSIPPQDEVISGLNTSSSASALLGPMMQERESRGRWWVSEKMEIWMIFFSKGF